MKKRQYDDLTNKKFGRLQVLYISNFKKSGKIYWHCKCQCGKEKDIRATSLISGATTSCGCYSKEKTAMINVLDITGQKFNHLTAISPTEKRSGKSIVWKCLCDCGNICFVSVNALTTEHTQSCGCLKSKGEQKIQSLLQENHIYFEKEKIFPTCIFPKTKAYARFDFYVDNRYLIQYDGQQHFKGGWNINLQEIKERDNFKDQWCFNNNILLLRIPYTEYESLNFEKIWIPKI